MSGEFQSARNLVATGALLGFAFAAPLLLLGGPWWILVVGPAVGALIGATRLRPLLWLGVAATALVVLILALTPVMERPVRSLIRADQATGAPLDAAVVLSEGVTSEGFIPSSAVNRLLSGIALVRAGDAPALVVMGVSKEYAGVEHFSEADQRRLLALADPGVPVHFVPLVRTTREEALATQQLAREHGWGRIAVVTSPTHTRRACAVFEGVGLSVRCVPADARDGIPPTTFDIHARFTAFYLWGYETAAIALYRSRGWIANPYAR
jgi:uncharacterized SAM-binding protein YcdF (DUF218 family)